MKRSRRLAIILTSVQLRAFAADGYLVVRGAVSAQRQAKAVTQSQSASAGRDFQFPLAAAEPELAELLTPALSLAEQSPAQRCNVAQQGVAPMLASGGHPAYAHDNPTPVLAQAGDTILSHYLLSHNAGPHFGSTARPSVCFRLQTAGHIGRWAAAIADECLEFSPAAGVTGRREVAGGKRRRCQWLPAQCGREYFRVSRRGVAPVAGPRRANPRSPLCLLPARCPDDQ